MRKYTFNSVLALAVSVASVATLQSCTKVAEKLHFNLKMQTRSVDFTIPVSSYTAGNTAIGPVTSSYNVDSFIKAQTGDVLGIKNIKSVKISSVKFNINNATTANNLQNLESAFASLTSDTYSEPFIVSKNNIPDSYAASTDLDVNTEAELKSYIGTQFSYILNAKLRKATTTPLYCTVVYTYDVEVEGTK